MPAMSKMVTLLTISVTLMLSDTPVFAKTVGPGQLKTSGTSAAPSGTGGSQVKHVTPPRVWVCRVGASGRQNCWFAPGGTTLPPCRGGHMGPNGVMIQCK
jgi:hypothetical protein